MSERNNRNRNLAKPTAAISEHKAEVDAIFASIGNGAITTDENGKINRINNTALNMLSYKESEVLGQWYPKVIQVEDLKGNQISPIELPITKALLRGKPITTKVTYIKRNGAKFPVDVTVSPILLNSKPIGAVEVFRDVSKEMEVDKAKTEFVSLASHQLRTPLSAINWYSEMLLAGDAGELTDKQKNLLNEIAAGNKRMVELVNSLLNVSRIDLGSFAIDPVDTQITEISDSLIQEMQPLVKAKKIKLTSKYGPKIPKVKLDPKLIRIVLQNLMSNAVKYTPNNGSVEVEIDKDTKNLNIKVKDNGLGIPKEQQDRIFSKLFRADNVQSLDVEGTGLGLYIVKSIIDSSGGKINFVSEEKKGTTFFIEIPLRGMKKKKGSKELD